MRTVRKIICMSRRNGRSSCRESEVMSVPSKRIVPLVGSAAPGVGRASTSTAGLTDDAEGLAAPDIERDAVDRVDVLRGPRLTGSSAPGSA
jgi:hypothetical protein